MRGLQVSSLPVIGRRGKFYHRACVWWKSLQSRGVILSRAGSALHGFVLATVSLNLCPGQRGSLHQL